MRINKSDTREYHNKWYQDNKEKRKAQIRAYQDRKTEEYKAFKATLSCQECGENSPCCLEFHHLDPSQKDTILSKVYNSWSKKRLQEELDKCVVLCSNCHRKVHAGVLQVSTQPSKLSI